MDKLNIGADQANRWRDRALHGRRRRLSHNVVSWAIIGLALAAGLAVRFLARDYTPTDAGLFVQWYELGLSAGADSLRQGLTNYAPLYSYAFYAITLLHDRLPVFASIKLISLPFELGCAAMAYRLVATSTDSFTRPAWAFAAVWLAPSVIFNGALWAQADAIWTFFIMVSLHAICRRRPVGAMAAFAFAVSIKLQAIFFGPMIFALVLRRELHWPWLALVPIVYALTAVPLLLLGRSVLDVLLVYQAQAEFFQELSKNAANLWIFVPNEFYHAGVVVGLVLAALAGLAFSLRVAREAAWTPLFAILAAAVCLQLMPWALPKMHERYFYAFEITMMVAAFAEPRLTFLALVAQIDALITYVGVDLNDHSGLGIWGPPFAAMINTVLLVAMIRRLTTDRYFDASPAFMAVIVSYVLWTLVVAGAGRDKMLTYWPAAKDDIAGLSAFLLILGLVSSSIAASSWIIRSRRKRP